MASDATFSLTTDTRGGGVGWQGCEQIPRLVDNSGSSSDYFCSAHRASALRNDFTRLPHPRRTHLRFLRPSRSRTRSNIVWASSRGTAHQQVDGSMGNAPRHHDHAHHLAGVHGGYRFCDHAAYRLHAFWLARWPRHPADPARRAHDLSKNGELTTAHPAVFPGRIRAGNHLGDGSGDYHLHRHSNLATARHSGCRDLPPRRGYLVRSLARGR